MEKMANETHIMFTMTV